MKTPRSEARAIDGRIQKLYEQTDDSLPPDIRLAMVEVKLKTEVNEKLKEIYDIPK